ncbi:MAG: hypothetical protein AB3N23_10860 [Paracoccaceae bacterium]
MTLSTTEAINLLEELADHPGPEREAEIIRLIAASPMAATLVRLRREEGRHPIDCVRTLE